MVLWVLVLIRYFVLVVVLVEKMRVLLFLSYLAFEVVVDKGPGSPPLCLFFVVLKDKIQALHTPLHSGLVVVLGDEICTCTVSGFSCHVYCLCVLTISQSLVETRSPCLFQISTLVSLFHQVSSRADLEILLIFEPVDVLTVSRPGKLVRCCSITKNRLHQGVGVGQLVTN